jgi:ABC-2 type transport system ATP-binding protein
MQVLLDIKNIKKIYKSKDKVHQALKGVSFSLYEGEVLGLLGVNGAGKTTLSSIIATLHPPTEGDILFHGKSIYANVVGYRKRLGFCPQKPNFEKVLTVEENLLYAGRYYGLSYEETKKRAQELMDRFELSSYAQSSPDVLSGGYKQRLLIARALIHKPALIILDEPTSAMDPHIRRELWQLIRSLKSEGVTVLLTTHYLDEAELLSDRVCILDNGLIRFIDTPENLKSAFNKGNLEDVFLHLVEEAKANT